MAFNIREILKMSPEDRARAEEKRKSEEATKAFQGGVSTIKDLIAPSAINIEFNHLRLGEFFVRSFFVYDYPRYLFTEWLSPIVNIDFTMDVGMHIFPVESKQVMDKLRVNVSRMEAAFGEQQEKGMVRDPTLEAQYRDAEELRDRLAAGEEKLFQFSLYLTVYAKSLEEIEEHTKQLETMLGGQLVMLKPAFLQMEEGFNSTLPLATDELRVYRNMTTSSLSTAFPFVSSELTSNEGVLYGLNRHTNGLVLFDRFELENANMVIFAKSGAGKSYAVKLEALRNLMFGTEVIIIDPENEYEALAKAVGGSHIKLSVSSSKRMNPFDLPKHAKEEAGVDALRSNIVILHGLMNLMLGTMNATESNIMDRGLVETYARAGITNEESTHSFAPPRMSDLQETLNAIEGGQDLAARLNKFTKGTFAGIFNEPTNVELDANMVVFSTRDLEDELRPVAMYIVLNFIWNKIKSEQRKRLLVIDEAWHLMKNEDSAQFVYGIAKRARKYFLGLTTITQDVDDFLKSQYGKAILTNSSLSLLLRQHPAAVPLVVKAFNLTEAEKYLLLNSDVGEGLFFAGQNHIAIQVVASYSEHKLVTTKPQELQEMAEAEQAAGAIESAMIEGETEIPGTPTL